MRSLDYLKISTSVIEEPVRPSGIFYKLVCNRAMNFLFWNINKKDTFFDLICEIVKDYSIGVLMLAEFPEGKQKELEMLLKAHDNTYRYHIPFKTTNKVEVYTNIPNEDFLNISDERRFSVKRYHSKGLNKDFNIILCHLDSKVNYDEREQANEARKVASEIMKVEEHYHNDLSIVCGDLNMNPFEEGLVGSACFNAVMSKNIARKGTRRVSGDDFKMFYNPMWGLYGDNGRGVAPGTFYYNPSRHMQYFWNIYDQVLIRPNVIPYFVDRYLEIVICSKSQSLLTDNHILKSIYSDHLPIKFSIKNRR